MTSTRLEQIAVAALIGSAGAVQFSIAAGQILLAVAVACWLAMLVVGRQTFSAPRIFWPLAVGPNPAMHVQGYVNTTMTVIMLVCVVVILSNAVWRWTLVLRGRVAVAAATDLA